MSIYIADENDPFVQSLKNFPAPEIPEDATLSYAGGKGELNPFYGMSHTEETRKQISETKKRQYATGEVVHPLLGVGHSEDTKRKMSEKLQGENHHMWGTKQSQKTILKRIAATTGRKNTDESKATMSMAAKNRQKIQCPSCGREGHPSNMKRWHFDNCKHR